MNENERATADTASGKVKGRLREGLYVFKGIPYAEPPVGKRRWAPPGPVQPWTGVREASEFSMAAPQISPPPGPLDMSIAEPQGEDCLYLNVWTPGLDDARRPVLVWIHGGAFNKGSGSQAYYDGRLLSLRGDVVVVTINYRLGVLGFLALDEVTGGRIPATGIEGLLDQVSALCWVRDNVAAFGGDPDNVTVFGESAGGMSIGCLLTMPAARGLFHKAILQSGSIVPPADLDAETPSRLMKALGVDPADGDGLMALPFEKLLAADLRLRMKMAGPGEPMRLTVTAPGPDGTNLPLSPLDAMRQGAAAPVPLLVGTNLEEYKLFALMDPDTGKLDEAMAAERLRFFLGSTYDPGLVEAYRRAKARRGDDATPSELLSAIVGDFMFRRPALAIVESWQRRGLPAYNYLFTWKSPALNGALGACHGLELGFVFGTHDDAFCGRGREADRLSRSMQDGWVAFARTGDPSCEGIGAWRQYGEERSTMLLGRECSLAEAPYDGERQAWEGKPAQGPDSA